MLTVVLFVWQFSPALVALLSTPLPPQSPPPAKLVAFFLKCLDRATKSPSISTIRPLYVLVANGYKHLTLQMSENQSHGFAKRMTGFLAEKCSADTDVNTFLTYCLATLAHMHLATEIKSGKTTAIGEFFQGKKAPMVLTLVINIVNVLASPETRRDWQEKIGLIRMATIIASAVSDQVKANGASSSDAASLVRLLEKARAQEDTRVVSEVLQFVSALSLVTPPAPLKATMEELLCRSRKEETTIMFLPLMSAGFFAVSSVGPVMPVWDDSDFPQQEASQRLVGDMLRSVIKHASANNQPTHSSYLLLRDRIEFIQKLSDDIPQSPHLRRHVLAALSTPELVPLVNDFIKHTNRPPVASEACSEGEACQWSIFSLTNRLQLALCTFILRCSFYSQAGGEGGGEGVQPLPASMATKIMEKLGSLSAAVQYQSQCPFEKTLKSKTSSPHDILSLIEEVASPEARISSRNWRQSLMQGLARDTDRQHGFIVSTVSEICRDLERRCENVEKPLRAEEENSRRLQAEVEKLKAQCADVEEQLGRCIHNLDHAAAENEMLENKLDCAMEKTKEAMERVKELEEMVEVEREEARQNIEELERELADTKKALERELLETKSEHLEELKAVKDAADQAAMEHMAALNSRQETIDQLQQHKRKLEQDADDAKDEISFLKEEKSRLEETAESLRKHLAGARQELGESKTQIGDLRHENETLGADKMSLQERMAVLEKNLDETCHQLDRYKTCLVQKIRDLDRQDQMLDELDYQKRRQKEQICLLERDRDDLDARVQELEKEVETAIRAGEEKLVKFTTELENKHEQEVSQVQVHIHIPSLTDRPRSSPKPTTITMPRSPRSQRTTRPPPISSNLNTSKR
jgi:predicted  nucleic acid-binding Zn-ribbon protein